MIFALMLLVVTFGAFAAWSLRQFYVSNLDAVELAAKLHTPRPDSARDWPELHVDAVVSDPEVPRRVLVLVRWPARPRPRSLLVLETVGTSERAARLLQQWRDADASVSPTRNGDGSLVLRRRRSPELLLARLVSEVRAA